jgi:alkylhydroperoxidase/carboxymuconolactone decarboxylase family protein YurZ
MHLRAALLSRDLSREELGELVLQLAPYAGFPAAAGLQGQLDEVVEALKTASETPPPPS